MESGDRHTNNTAEIQAATFAICQARGLGVRKLNIHTGTFFYLYKMLNQTLPYVKLEAWASASLTSIQVPFILLKDAKPNLCLLLSQRPGRPQA